MRQSTRSRIIQLSAYLYRNNLKSPVLFTVLGWHDAIALREENGEKMAYTVLTEAYKQHEQGLLKQMLNMAGLSFLWLDVLIPLVHEIVNVIRPGTTKS